MTGEQQRNSPMPQTWLEASSLIHVFYESKDERKVRVNCLEAHGYLIFKPYNGALKMSESCSNSSR